MTYEQANRNVREFVDGLPAGLRKILQRAQGADRDVQCEVALSFNSLTRLQPHEAPLAQGWCELKRRRVERNPPRPMRAWTGRWALAQELADQLSPFFRDYTVALQRAARHSFVDQDHDDLALHRQFDRRRPAIGLTWPISHWDPRTVAQRADGKGSIEARRHIPGRSGGPMKQNLDAK